jgi:Methyltransferase domain
MNIHDFYRPFQRYFRSRRMKQFAEFFSPDANTRIIDIGGGCFNWQFLPTQPKVHLVNQLEVEPEGAQFTSSIGDGRCLQFDNNSFDVAYSNSVIEHVGCWEQQMSFANEVRRVAKRYYVQTPNRGFVVDTHFVAHPPFMHLAPGLMRRCARFLSVWGWIIRPSQKQLDEFLNDIKLLNKEEMQRLFPDATIVEERFLRMRKSLIAMKL